MPRRARSSLSPDDRRDAILGAALDVFSERGFEAARLEDVAVRAGVAKGTLYLHFRSKQDLLEQLVTGAVGPLLEKVAGMAGDPDLSMRESVAILHRLFVEEVLATRRKEVLRLVVAEGARFPQIADFYRREVIARGLPLLRALAQRGVSRKELASDELVRFPHLVVAPLLLAVVWDGLFSCQDPLDVEGLLAAHRASLFGAADTSKDSTP